MPEAATPANRGSMFKTTNNFIDGFTGFLVYLPLLPVFLIYWKKLYRRDSLNFLMVICLLQFIQRICLQIEAIPASNIPAYNNIFSLLITLLYFFIFSKAFDGRSKEFLQLFSVAFFSSIITYSLVKSMKEVNQTTRIAEYIFTVALIVYCLATLIYYDNLRTMQMPIFWIACGTLFYILIHTVTEFADRIFQTVDRRDAAGTGIEKILILDIADLVRYIFYTIAVWVSMASIK
jgi:hypothetical protein